MDIEQESIEPLKALLSYPGPEDIAPLGPKADVSTASPDLPKPLNLTDWQ